MNRSDVEGKQSKRVVERGHAKHGRKGGIVILRGRSRSSTVLTNISTGFCADHMSRRSGDMGYGVARRDPEYLVFTIKWETIDGERRKVLVRQRTTEGQVHREVLP